VLTLETYNDICAALPATNHVVQWGGAHVWKVGDKVFAIGAVEADGRLHVTFKVSDAAWELYREAPGLRPAPYLASRGFKWLQRTDDSFMDDAMLADYLGESHRLAAANLSAAKRRNLGL
jgi:Uncharacterized protein conserved in bacteria